MKADQTSYSIDKVITLKDSVLEFLTQKNLEENEDSTGPCIQGGVLSDMRYSWLANGPRLEILHSKSGVKVAAWTFGAVLRDFGTRVSCVTDVANSRLVVVGLECELTGGMVCVLDVGRSRVVRALQVPERVSSVHVVAAGGDGSLPGPLRALDGVLAVGTAHGRVLLVDLCRQACEEALSGPEGPRDEVTPCQLIPLSARDLKHLERHKELSVRSGDHLCLQLNEASTAGPHFALRGPQGEERLHVRKAEVAVSALHYCPQLAALLVGYNFGAFQLYDVLGARLQYTSPVYEDFTPVAHFAVQEPCDDPRAFCYVWAVYSGAEPGDASYPVAVLYALAYQSKEHLEGYGPLYQDLVSCSVRFQVELTPSAGPTAPGGGARCLSLRAHAPSAELALCALVWTTWNAAATHCNTYLCLFDLNQWYKEQMPSTPRLGEDNAAYMTCVCLSELLGSVDGGAVLDARLDPTTLNQFVAAQRLEEHYHPAALAFRCVCVRERDLVWLGTVGAQRHFLTQLERTGPLCLLRPSELHRRCLSLGLAPVDGEPPPGLNPLDAQRELLLGAALEHQLVGWLCHVARAWADGSHAAAGCTLSALLAWAWRRANALKTLADQLCAPLFDHSGQRPDSNALTQLNHCACQLKHLATLQAAVAHSNASEELDYRGRALHMISVYAEVLQWLLNVGLLPECPADMYPRDDERERISAPYPVDSLSRFYHRRREELRRLQDAPLLFIDNLVERECGGAALRDQWRRDGGDGLYPPPSLQALLRVYLVDDVDMVHKHSLLVYVFLDLAMSLDQSRYKPIITHLIKFPAVFKLSPSVIKITQAFWQLDHGDFSTAMAQLLDPGVDGGDLRPWHHRTLLRALLLQGQHQHALLYQQVRRPSLASVHDVCIVITLLVVNDMLQEAFHFQRQNRAMCNEKELLKHFFEVCDKTNQLASILQLPLCPAEEEEFIKYMKANPNESNKNLLVIFHLQRDRYGDAFEMNDFLNNNEIGKQGLLGQQEKHFRNVIVKGFKKTLPAVTQTLLEYCKKQKENLPVNVSRPVPMSVYVHDSNEQARYKSTLIQASFQKAKETWTQGYCHPDDTPFLSTPKVQHNTNKNDTPIIYATVKYPADLSKLADELEDEATPAKRMRLSPRPGAGAGDVPEAARDPSRVSRSLLSTPIVKRRSYRLQAGSNDSHDFGIGTPPSILKVRSFLRSSASPERLRGTSTTPEQLEDETSEDGLLDMDAGVTPLDNSTASVGQSLSYTRPHRRSVMGVSPRKPIQRTPRPIVRFEDARRSHELEMQVPVHKEATPDSKNSSKSTEDVFYSPNTSMTESLPIPMDTNVVEQPPDEPVEQPRRTPLKRKASESGGVQARRSYKTATPKSTPKSTPAKEESFPRLAGRRSLTRQALENNTLARIQTPLQTPLSLVSLTKSPQSIELSFSKSSTSITKTSTDNLIEESCDKSTCELKNVFTMERDPNTSTQIIKHTHNESHSKSSVKKVTEILDAVGPQHVLSFNSDVEDSFVEKFCKDSSERVAPVVSNQVTEQVEDDVAVTDDSVKPNASDTSCDKETSTTPDDNNTDVQQLNKTSTNTDNLQPDVSVTTDCSLVVAAEQVAELQEQTAHDIKVLPEVDQPQSSDSNQMDVVRKEETIIVVGENANEQEQAVIIEGVSDTEEDDVNVVEEENVEEEENLVEEESVKEDDNVEEEELEMEIDQRQSEEDEESSVAVSNESDVEERVSDNEEEDNALDEEAVCEEEHLSVEQKSDKGEEDSEMEDNQETSSEESSNQSSASSDVIEIKSSSEESLEELRMNKSDEQDINELEQNIQASEEEHTDREGSEVNGNVAEQIFEQLASAESDTSRPGVPEDCLEYLGTAPAEVHEQLYRTDILSQDFDQPEEAKEEVVEETAKEEEVVEETAKAEEVVEETAKAEVGVRTRRRSTSVHTEEPATEADVPWRRTTRASSVASLTAIEEKPAARTRRASSMSVDSNQSSVASSRARRGASLEPELTTLNKSPARRGRKRSVQPEVIPEETVAPLEAAPGGMEEYTATHRLTRRQKMIMEKSMELQQMKQVQEPVQRLEKDRSESPDVEEQLERAPSPSSSVSTQSSVATRSSSRLRGRQQHSPGAEDTPRRKRGRPPLSAGSPGRRQSFTLAQQAITTPTRPARRSARTNSDASDASSVMSVPVIELQRLDDQDLLRHRSLSPTMLQPDSTFSSPRSKRKSTRTSILPLRTDLSKISEESGSNPDKGTTNETVEEVVRRKRGRPKKSDQQIAQSNQSSQEVTEMKVPEKSQPVYRALGDYLPQYVTTKTRKSFKLKKITRTLK